MDARESMDYKSFYERVGARNGWDFSSVKAIAEGVAWDYAKVVQSRCKASDTLLDIGTGGGELLLRIADAAGQLVGIDHAAGMVETARRNAEREKRQNVRFMQIDAEDALPFPDASFDVVCCRHAPFRADESGRVLKPGGVLVTQQVGEGDKRNLAQAFGRGRSEATTGSLMRKYAAELNAAGFVDVQCFQYDADEYYATAEDLIFLLKHAPIIPGFGERDEDFAVLERFVADNRSDKGIRTNSERSLIIANKKL
ncbi:class I SAM-dependent methyltransferase [Paenibacillus rhizovicinus]|uniref:Class I SAM-dependent methyltransferase n=2 Tax=Paenibacillus rhizovicinus TaxID=2704463 RepID=A0A6C0P9D1_9BACL|nr:class I SAM-dependent methyltransferase [Paenibacillus rhizovicinus]